MRRLGDWRCKCSPAQAAYERGAAFALDGNSRKQAESFRIDPSSLKSFFLAGFAAGQRRVDQERERAKRKRRSSCE